ncbi:uncharacterized protein [Polyergus mexicanus]|uniref:uncharacterized protein n=1 Tax=Polyergus mexicanus TaxID=615972 RepID=UPI0038B64473
MDSNKRIKNVYERLTNDSGRQRTVQERLLDGYLTAQERVRNGYERLSNGNECRTTKNMTSLKSNGRKNIEKLRLVEELHASARRNFPRRRVIVRGYDDLWQADIVEMRPYSRFNKGYHYILTVIDVLSKYAWAVPLKSKGGSETADAIAEIIRDSKRCPKNMQTDMGKEFYNIDVQRLIRKHDINHYSTYSVLKASKRCQFFKTSTEKFV